MSVPSLNIYRKSIQKISKDIENLVVNYMRVIFGTSSIFACCNKGKLYFGIFTGIAESVSGTGLTCQPHCHDKIVKFGYGQ